MQTPNEAECRIAGAPPWELGKEMRHFWLVPLDSGMEVIPHPVSQLCKSFASTECAAPKNSKNALAVLLWVFLRFVSGGTEHPCTLSSSSSCLVALLYLFQIMPSSAEEAGVPNDAAAYLLSLEDPEVVERVRCTIPEAHIFKLPPRQTAGGWRGADWDKEVWQGTLKVVERGELTVILLVDSKTGAIFAVCPVNEGAVDRCIDSSRYFVLKVEHGSTGKHMFIGLAFNERNDAFDFNTSLADAQREKQAEIEAIEAAKKYEYGPTKDYSMKEGQKIHIAVDKVAKKTTSKGERRSSASGTTAGGGFLKPSSKDTPRRASALGGS